MRDTFFTIAFLVVSFVLTASGALQCFAPRRLKELQDRLRGPGDYKASAGGAFFEKLREKQAENPSVLFRLSGLAMMATGLWLCWVALRKLFT